MAQPIEGIFEFRERRKSHGPEVNVAAERVVDTGRHRSHSCAIGDDGVGLYRCSAALLTCKVCRPGNKVNGRTGRDDATARAVACFLTVLKGQAGRARYRQIGIDVDVIGRG